MINRVSNHQFVQIS